MTCRFSGRALPFCFVLVTLAAPVVGARAAAAQTADPTATPTVPSVAETIQVTATRVPEDVEPVPSSITVISGDELRARGVVDLPGALAMVAGVNVSPGGDVGPAGSVPEIWGLREFDAFLLVVDGVPWGGAFNPALTTLDLTDVDRIEVLRGSAPVMYGATSFVGVIHVLHRQAGAPGGTVQLSAGSYGSGKAAVALALPGSGSFRQSLSVSGEKRGFKDDRTGFDRGHVLYRAATGGFHLDVDATLVDQDPASPHPREGRALSSAVPLDANHNPKGAKIDERRYQLTGGYDRSLGGQNAWSTTLSVTRSDRDTLRGFLTDVVETDPNARGFEQDLTLDDVYFDTHVALHPSSTVQIVAGFDHLYGKAKADSETFDYFVPLRGGNPSVADEPHDMAFDFEDERNFSGLYLQTEWSPVARFRLQVGARLNRTQEKRDAGEEELDGGEGENGVVALREEGDGEEEGAERTKTRASGSIGASWLAWQQDNGGIWLYGDYRNTYKPAALDFGPEAEPDILDPETARSYEVGLKGRHERFDWEVSAFQMDFENLVISQTNEGGLPELVNAGAERFKGVELEAEYHFLPDLIGRANWALHDAKFRDFEQELDGVPTQLAGNRLEMSARQLGGAELAWFPARGWNGFASWQRIGERFLNKRNTATDPAYDTLSAGFGYGTERWSLLLEGDNLTDERPPVAESELGDAQYYRLPARMLRLTWTSKF
jgi:outer membrane receptor protein involved in Fe transport